MSLIGKIYRQIEPLIEIFYRTTRQSKTAADPSQWKEQAQKGEFAFHKNDTWRQTEGFLQQTSVLFKSWGFEADEFEGQIVLDVGAGSMLRGCPALGWFGRAAPPAWPSCKSRSSTPA